MKENNITKIIQLGDFLDNRTQLNIALWSRIKEDILDVLLEEGILIYTLLGNHDITLRESLDISFMYTISHMYNNITLINTPTFIEINNKQCLLQPWLCSDEKMSPIDLVNSDYIFGHFETIGYTMTKGQMCQDGLEADTFNPQKIEKVYSGHFHTRSKKGKIEYIGTPYALNWNDYNGHNGFMVFDGDLNNEEFILNNVSSKFVKIKYNDTKDKLIEIKGLYNDTYFCDTNDIPYKDLHKHNIKFFINHSETSKFEEVIYNLKENDIQFSVTNNVEIGKLINCNYSAEVNDKIDTHEFILEAVDSKDNNLIGLLKEIMIEARSLEV